MKFQRIIFETIIILFVALWGYAAFSKVFEFELFRNNLSISPLLKSIYVPVAILVPTIELIIVVLLLIEKTQRIGLFLSGGLLILFNIYLTIILINYRSNLPCTCGGIISKMSWGQHIVFNVAFIILAIIGLFLKKYYSDSRNNNLIVS